MDKSKERYSFQHIWIIGILLYLVILLCCGCGQQEEENAVMPDNIVTLHAVILGNEPEKGMTELYEALDELTIPELGCILRLEFVPWGNERQQLNIAAASGEYDLLPNGVFSDYQALIAKKAFLDLNDYLHLVPVMVEHYQYYDEDYLKKYEINGSLYGIPQYGQGSLIYTSEGFFYREDLRKEWGLEEITDFDSLEAYLYRAKSDPRYQEEALITDNRIWQSLWIMLAGGKYLEIDSMQTTPFVVVEAKQPDVAINRLETPEFQEILSILKRWRADGILEANMLALSDNEGSRALALLLADRKPCESNVPIWSLSSNFLPQLVAEHVDWEYGFYLYISTNEQHYKTSPVGSSVISISSKTRYPEIAIRLLEKIHTDQRYYDLIQYGVEDIHYHIRDGKISYEGIDSTSRFRMTVAGDGLLNRVEEPASEQWGDIVVQFEAWSEETMMGSDYSPIDGFVFTSTGLNQIIDDMEGARLQYFQPLVCGYYEEEDDIAEVVAELVERGLDQYLNSIQNQLQEYLNN